MNDNLSQYQRRQRNQKPHMSLDIAKEGELYSAKKVALPQRQHSKRHPT
jgi:hypothetical protein